MMRPFIVLLSISFAVRAMSLEIGSTEIAKWKDNKQSVFLIAFDDNCPSHLAYAIPTLVKYGFPGTFYINPSRPNFQAKRAVWLNEIPRLPGIVYGNHTYSHCGATNALQLDEELATWHATMTSCYANREKPFLLSFGKPGGVPWNVTESEKEALLTKYDLIERPPFLGGGMAIKTIEQMNAHVDKGMAKGEMNHLDFHGVGGDWLKVDMDFFTALMEKLAAHRDRIWVTDHISYHQYLTERKTARVTIQTATPSIITLALSTSADPRRYGYPLTLQTRVPAHWTHCTITQGTNTTTVAVTRQLVQYAAVPNRAIIQLTPQHLKTKKPDPHEGIR